jgi:hypothetical protein
VLYGFPGALLLGPGGAPLPTFVKTGGDLSFLQIPVTTVDIGQGTSAYFNMGYSDVVSGNETSCPTSSSIEITPPNDTQQLTLSASIGACDGGELSVSPVFGPGSPGTSTTAPPTG